MHFATGTNFGLICLLSRHGFYIGNDLINNLWLVHPPEPRAGVIAMTIVDRNMQMFIVRIATSIFSVTLLSSFLRPNLSLKD